MNDYDRNNLQFLLKASAKDLEAWSKEVTQDDLDYAQELLAAYQEEINAKEAELDIVIDTEFEQALIDAHARGSVYYEFEEYSVH